MTGSTLVLHLDHLQHRCQDSADVRRVEGENPCHVQGTSMRLRLQRGPRHWAARSRQRQETRRTEANYRHQQFKEHCRWCDKFLWRRQRSRSAGPMALGNDEDIQRGGAAHGHRREEQEEAEAAQPRMLLQVRRTGASKQRLPHQESSGTCCRGSSNGTTRRGH